MMLSCRGLFAWRILRLTVAAGSLVGACSKGLADFERPGAGPVDALTFEGDIWPILAANCVECHGADRPKAGLDLRSVSVMLRGGKSGPALNLDDPGSSLLLERITSGDMPPGKARKLTAREIAAVRSWISTGARADDPAAVPPAIGPMRAEGRQFWSFRPLKRPPVPDVAADAKARTPIDSFLLTRLEAKGLGFSRQADASTLVRRVYLDLIGLPPSLEEVGSYLADGAPGAYERLVDKLLASPHFGERWGRHWLDITGYVDTVGFDTDATNIILAEGKWRYRDYVIKALNQDKPYDQFITEQFAGDELFDWRRAVHFTPEMREALIATGYLRTARDLTHEDVGVIPQNFFGILHDTIEIIGTGLLGLTLNCARCHDHKFDPIPQEDYYRLMAIFTPAYNPNAWRPVIPTETKSNDRALPDASPADYEHMQRQNAEIDRRIAELQGRLTELNKKVSDRLIAARAASLPAQIRADVLAAIRTPAGMRDPVQKYLAAKFEPSLTVKPDEISAGLSTEEKAQAKLIDNNIHKAKANRKTHSKIQALYDLGPAPKTHLLVRGSELSPGPEVQAGFLRALCQSEADAVAKCRSPYPGTSGRRGALARWLTNQGSPASALLARVMVNRIWKQIFGQGIVPSVDNFGVQGQPPTHPELLEWLSKELVASGWRIKPLCRLLVTSTAYRQASRREPARAASGSNPESIDPGNELLWRMRLRRLESEIVRDSILTVSGDRDLSLGGPPVPIATRPDGLVEVARDRLVRPGDAYKRSIYLTTRRAYNPSLLTVFDQPLVATNCVRRATSAVPLQSLIMLHDVFTVEQARHFAARIERAGPRAPDERIDLAFRLALMRHPNQTERHACTDLLKRQTKLALPAADSQEEAERQALIQLCLTLYNTSEFLYAE
jgi:mono/diheme cytochrome c family protein